MSRRSPPQREVAHADAEEERRRYASSVAGTDIDVGTTSSSIWAWRRREEREVPLEFLREEQVLSYASKQTSTHIGFVLVFAIFSITLSPFSISAKDCESSNQVLAVPM